MNEKELQHTHFEKGSALPFFSIGIALFCPLWMVFYIYHGLIVPFLFVLLSFLTSICVWFLYKKYDKQILNIGSNLLCLSICITLCINSSFTSGHHSPIKKWLAVVPMISIFLTNIHQGSIWLIILLVLQCFIYSSYFPSSFDLLSEDLEWQLSFAIEVSLLFALFLFSALWHSLVMRQINEMKKATEDRDKALNARSKFLTSMSHELRTPLHGLLGAASLLIELEKKRKLSKRPKNGPSVSSYCSNLNEAKTNRCGDDADEERWSLLNTIEVTGKLLLSHINNLLDYTKIDLHQLRIHCSPTLLVKQIIEPVSHLANQLKHIGFERPQVFKWILDQSLEPFISQNNYDGFNNSDDILFETDSYRITQILINFMQNSFRHAYSSSGVVEILLRVSLTIEQHKQYLLFETIDNGEIKLDEEQKKQIFLPFHQLDHSESNRNSKGEDTSRIRSPTVKGTGLGLAICQEIVCLMNGEIGVKERTDGKPGNIFWLTVPFVKINKSMEFSDSNICCYASNDEYADGDNIIVSLNRPLQNQFNMQNNIIKPRKMAKTPECNILIVDDNEINKKIIIKMLVGLGYSLENKFNIDTCANGQMMVNQRSKKFYNIIFTDISMPVINGFKASRLIRELESNNSSTPNRNQQTQEEKSSYSSIILAVTAHNLNDESIRRKCKENGIDGWLVKPFTPEELRSIIDIFM